MAAVSGGGGNSPSYGYLSYLLLPGACTGALSCPIRDTFVDRHDTALWRCPRGMFLLPTTFCHPGPIALGYCLLAIAQHCLSATATVHSATHCHSLPTKHGHPRLVSYLTRFSQTTNLCAQLIAAVSGGARVCQRLSKSLCAPISITHC